MKYGSFIYRRCTFHSQYYPFPTIILIHYHDVYQCITSTPKVGILRESPREKIDTREEYRRSTVFAVPLTQRLG
ncbi:hypothetical protein CBS147324_4867 [Aspergillus niger]|nr:hypothetical protein CBS147324_4867 [Aspergillus niger]